MAAQAGSAEAVPLLSWVGTHPRKKIAFSPFWVYSARMLPDYELIAAVKRNSVQGMTEAIEKGAWLAAKDFGGFGLLEVAQRNQAMDAGRKLLELGLNPNEVINKLGDTLLHRCAKTGDFGFTCLLLEHGANPNLGNASGKTPLYYAKKNGYEYMRTRLQAAGSWYDTAEVTKVAEARGR